MSGPATPSKGAEKGIPAETVALLVATLMKSTPAISFNYKLMSSLSAMTDSHLTQSSIEHQFRAIKKRANELLTKANELEGNGVALEPVPVGAGRKRGAPAAGKEKASPKTPAKKSRTIKGDEDDEENPTKKARILKDELKQDIKAEVKHEFVDDDTE